MKNLVIVLLVFPVLLSCISCSQDPEKIVGIKIYDYDKDFYQLTEKWKEMGINTAFVSKELASDTIFRKLLKENNIGVYIIFPVFHDPELLMKDSTLYAITDKGEAAKDDWVEFVCPSRVAYRSLKVSEAADLVRVLDPEGLSIDFIRQFVFWEMIYPDRSAESIDMACFCDTCTGNFCRHNNVALPDTCKTAAQKASYIFSYHSEAWNNYRCDLIASMVKEISDKVHTVKPGIKINVHAVPWRDEDFKGANTRVAGQDLRKIAPYTDFISPMCYSQMVRRDAGWIESVVTQMDKKAPGKILPSIQVYPYYVDDVFTADDFEDCIDAALKKPSRGVVFFSWPLFEKDTLRMESVMN